MLLEQYIQRSSLIISLLLLIWKRKELKEFIPVGLFASFYANIICYISVTLNWWNYSPLSTNFHINGLSSPTIITLNSNFRLTELVVDCVVVPVIAMFWVKYISKSLRKQIMWAFVFTIILTLIEYIIERNTNVIKYSNGYEWYYSFILWFFSWFIWYKFHLWFYRNFKLL